MADVNFLVYRTSDYLVVRWGSCDDSMVAAQAGAGEGAAVTSVESFDTPPGSLPIMTFYDPGSGQFTYSGVGAAGESTAEEAARERRYRNDRLRETDYTQLGDVPISAALKASFAAYRQSLRDLPTSTGWPYNITWPTLPTYTKET